MTPARHARLMHLFDEVCESEPAEANRFIDALEADDAELRDALRAMLVADRQTLGLLGDSPPPLPVRESD